MWWRVYFFRKKIADMCRHNITRCYSCGNCWDGFAQCSCYKDPGFDIDECESRPVMLARIPPSHETIILCVAVLFLQFDWDGFFCPLFKPILCFVYNVYGCPIKYFIMCRLMFFCFTLCFLISLKSMLKTHTDTVVIYLALCVVKVD